MILEDNSLLLKLHETKIDEKSQLFFDALVYTIQTIDLSYSKINELLDVDGATDNAPIMRESWVIIDNLYRLKCLIGIMPLVKRNVPWFQLTIRKLSLVESSRHFIEHYDGELPKLFSNVQPLVGHIAYVKRTGEKQFATAVRVQGKLRKYKGLTMVNPAGKVMRGKIDHITLCLGDNVVDISEVYYQLKGFITEMENYVKDKYSKPQSS